MEYAMDEQRTDWVYGSAFLLLVLVFGAGVAEEARLIAAFPVEVYTQVLWVIAACLWGVWAVTKWRA